MLSVPSSLWQSMLVYPRRPTAHQLSTLLDVYRAVPAPLVKLLSRSGLRLILMGDRQSRVELSDGLLVDSPLRRGASAYYNQIHHFIVSTAEGGRPPSGSPLESGTNTFTTGQFREYVMLHELAHAVEKTLESHWGIRRDLAGMLHQSHRGSRLGAVTNYAETNPAEYFAESFAHGAMDSRRGTLERLDPAMASFVAALLRPSCTEPESWSSRLLQELRRTCTAKGGKPPSCSPLESGTKSCTFRGAYQPTSLDDWEACHAKGRKRRTDIQLLDGLFHRGDLIRVGSSFA